MEEKYREETEGEARVRDNQEKRTKENEGDENEDSAKMEEWARDVKERR